jgi:integrase
MNASMDMQTRVESYLACRRQAGYVLKIEGEQLLRFARFAEQVGHQGTLTLELAKRWASISRRRRALTAARRIEVLRGFARYCQQFDTATEIPPLGLFGRAHRRLTPRIYTDTEIRALLAATVHLHPPDGLRSACCKALFGLIASTGLRVSEATGIMRVDVDLHQGLLHIRGAKFGKSRWVPLHQTTTHALKQYVRQRDNDPKALPVETFFVGDYGRPVRTDGAEYAFRLLRRRLQWPSRGDHRALRIHDLRHTFICRTLQRWYENGVDIDRSILALSTYVGHVNITDTYWYVTATPELMAIAARRFEPCGSGVPS